MPEDGSLHSHRCEYFRCLMGPLIRAHFTLELNKDQSLKGGLRSHLVLHAQVTFLVIEPQGCLGIPPRAQWWRKLQRQEEETGCAVCSRLFVAG